MKKFLYFLAAAAFLFTACGDDVEDVKPSDPDTPANNPVVIDFADYSHAVGLILNQMLDAFGDPDLAFEGFYSFELSDGKTESLTFMLNTGNDKAYTVMQILAEDAYKFEDIYRYFASKYTVYEYTEADTYEEDGEVYETEPSAIFGNTEEQADATLIIMVSGNSAVSYSDPTNVPSDPEPGTVSFADVAPQDAAALFLGRSWDEVKEEYADVIVNYAGINMIFVEDNDYYTCLYFEIVEGIVDKVMFLFDDFEDNDAAAIAYFESLGYTVTDCGEEDGEHVYFCVNMETMNFFTYTGCIATFVWADPNAGYDDGEDED